MFRSQVNVAPLQWDISLENDAQNWASYLASLGSGMLVHQQGTGEGENLYAAIGCCSDPISAITAWGREKTLPVRLKPEI